MQKVGEGKEFTTIQAAVNVAEDGDIIIVKEGAYNVWCPTTDPNNYTGRDHNLFIGKNITIKGEGVVDIYSLQAEYLATFDARIIVLISGSDGVVLENLNIYPVYYPGEITTGLPSVVDSKINSITGESNLKVYYNQIVDTLMNYNGGKPTSESTITNVTVRGCTIGDPDLAAEDWGSAIYFNGYVSNTPNGISGGYTVEGNTFYGSLTHCENASWEANSENIIIQNNHFYGNLHLVGKRPTGWNDNSLSVFPTVIGNTFYKANASITDTVGTTYDYFVGSRDISQEKLITEDQLETIIKDNFFKGDLDGKEIDIAIGAHTYSTPGDECHAIIYVKKVTPVVDTAIEATAVTAGQTLADSELSGTFKVSAEDGTEVAGTFAWDTPTTVVNDIGEFGWTFTPVDRLTYNVVKGIVSVVAVHPKDITVASANDSGIKDSEAYKGVAATFTLGGADIGNVKSVKAELFDAEDNLLATNTLRSSKFPVSAGGLTAPIVAIEGTYAYGSWEKTVWAEGNPDPLTPPSYVKMTLTDENGLTYSAEESNLHTLYSGGKTWSQLWAKDITVASANDSGINDSAAYKGVVATFKLGGTDLEGVESIKVEVFDAEDTLLATNILKSDKLPKNAGNLTSPIVAIEGTYEYGAWYKTEWAEGYPDPLTPPSYVKMTLTDENGLTYSAKESNLHTLYSGGGDWASLWGIDHIVTDQTELNAAIVQGGYIYITADIVLDSTLDIADKTITLDLNGHKLSTPDASGAAAQTVLKITGASNVTIQGDGLIQSGTTSSKESSGLDWTPTIHINNDSSSLTIKNSAVIKGGDAINSYDTAPAIWGQNFNELTITGATIRGGDHIKKSGITIGYNNYSTAGHALALMPASGKTVNITNSTISGGNGINEGYEFNKEDQGYMQASGGQAFYMNQSNIINITDSIIEGGDSALHHGGHAIAVNNGVFNIINSNIVGGDGNTYWKYSVGKATDGTGTYNIDASSTTADGVNSNQ